ncbi:DNA primase, partial [Escherichia coli]
VEQDDKGWDARKRAYCLKIQPATGSFARNLIYSTKPCEGAFDVMGVKRAIFDEETLRDYVEPIGTFGMHLSGNTTQDAEDQLGAFLTLKARGLRNVIMMWDSEKQAIRNTMAAARRLTSIGLNVKVACLGEEGLDPGDATPGQIIKAYYCAKPYSRQLELLSKVKGIAALV